jgi:hypothetical protein
MCKTWRNKKQKKAESFRRMSTKRKRTLASDAGRYRIRQGRLNPPAVGRIHGKRNTLYSTSIVKLRGKAKPVKATQRKMEYPTTKEKNTATAK